MFIEGCGTKSATRLVQTKQWVYIHDALCRLSKLIIGRYSRTTPRSYKSPAYDSPGHGQERYGSLASFPVSSRPQAPYVTFIESLLSFSRKAVFLSRLNRREEAIESILRSISGYHWNWSVWTLLCSCVGDGDEVG